MLVTIHFVAASDCGIWARHRSDPFFMGEVGNAHEIRLSRERDDAVAEDGYFVAVIERERVDRAAISLSLSLWNVTERRIRVLADGRTNGRYVLSFKC